MDLIICFSQSDPRDYQKSENVKIEEASQNQEVLNIFSNTSKKKNNKIKRLQQNTDNTFCNMFCNMFVVFLYYDVQYVS